MTAAVQPEAGISTRFGVHSEVGKLRRVIIHRPDLELKRLTPNNHDIPTSCRIAMNTPNTTVMGAVTTIVHDITTSICTCWTSLVVRVISVGAPKRPTSRSENSLTRWKMADRRSRPKLMPARAPK